MNGDDSHYSGMGIRRQAPLARECTYSYFMKCKPLYFKGTKRVVELTQWNVGHDVVYAITWTNLKKKMTDKVFHKESDKIEKYVYGLPDIIHGSVMASKPKTMQDAIEFATELIDKKISTLAERQAENKRKLDNNNQAQQQPPKQVFHKESDKIEKYVYGLPDIIHGSVMASKPKTMQDAIEFATELIDKKISTLAENKRKLDNNNQAQQQPPKQSTGAGGMVHALGGGETNQDLNDMKDDINA
nr:hypothetical protein [Tanacetum cinerariifolium]